MGIEICHVFDLWDNFYFRLKLSVSRHMMFRTVATTVANNASGSIAGSESAIVDIVTQLGATFTKLIELMLSKEIKVCIK